MCSERKLISFLVFFVFISMHFHLSESVDDVICNFTTNNCGFYNQHNMLSYFKRINKFPFNIISGNGMLFLDLIWSASRRSSGARLISPYFRTNGQTQACLMIKFLTWGHGITKLLVIQQDKSNKCIWQWDNNNYGIIDPDKYWTTAQIPVHLSDGDPRFFIEAHTVYHQYGFVVIDDIVLSYKNCTKINPNQSCSLTF